jgi:hypothetical protein
MLAQHIRVGDRIQHRDGVFRTVLSVGPMDGHIEVESAGGRIDLFKSTDDVQRLTCSCEHPATAGPWDDFS